MTIVGVDIVVPVQDRQEWAKMTIIVAVVHKSSVLWRVIVVVEFRVDREAETGAVGGSVGVVLTSLLVVEPFGIATTIKSACAGNKDQGFGAQTHRK